MERKGLEEPLLEHLQREQRTHSQSRSRRWLYFAIASLLLSNSFLLINVLRASAPCHDVTKFAGLSYSVRSAFDDWTQFRDPKIRNQSWHDMDLTPIKVLYTNSEAKQLGLEISKNRFPWDETRGIYILKVFHDLHCLKYIQYAFEHPGDGSLEHVYHCLDSLRQDLMCNADDYPMPVTELPDKLGNGYLRQCRDIDELIRWTRLPERFPCYFRPADDPREPEKQIEAYGYCTEESPYYEAQEAYFAKWGRSSRLT